jgi:hypothetical protein
MTASGRTETEALPDSGHFRVRPLSSAATGGCRPVAACRVRGKRTFADFAEMPKADIHLFVPIPEVEPASC